MTSFGPFSVRPQQIERLNPSRFTSFVNRLLAIEVAAHQMAGVALETTYRDNIGDEGVDAGLRVSTGTSWIPDGESAWQFKAGDLSPSKCKNELEGATRALEILRAGGRYRLVLGVTLTSTKLTNRRKALREKAAELGITLEDDTLEVITADGLARWAEKYPALSASRVLDGIGHVGQPFDEWSKSNRHASTWISSDSRDAEIDDIRSVISGADQFDLHIHGVSGTGKTRLVMEAVREQPYESLVLYAPAADQFPVAVLGRMQSQDRAGVVVVDECDSKMHEIYASTLAEGTSLRLITMGEDDARSTRSPMIGLGGLEDDAMKELLRVNQPGIWNEARDVIVDVAAGNIDYALKAARAVVESDIVSAGQLVTAGDIRSFITDSLPGGALFLGSCVLSLLDRIGFEGEVAYELSLLAESLGIPERELREAARVLEDHGLLNRQGRFRSVAPHPVAVYLAARGWSELRERIIDDLIPALNLELTERLFRRAVEIGDTEATRPAVEQAMRHDGPLGTWESLEQGHNAKLLVHFAVLAPATTVLHLEELMAGVADAELHEARAIRRDVVWSLEKLAWRPDTFEPAADLLMRLALAENEDYSNNATGTWIALFGTMLPGTAASPRSRLSYLQTRAETSDAAVRRLVVLAARRALTFHESITVSAERQGGIVVEPRGSPKTYGEAWEYMTSMMDILLRVHEESDGEIAEEALVALIGAIHRSLEIPPLRSHLAEILGTLDEAGLRQVRLEIARLSTLFDRVDADDERVEGLREVERSLPPESAQDVLWELAHMPAWEFEEDLPEALVAAIDNMGHEEGIGALLGVLEHEELPASFHVGRALARAVSHTTRYLDHLSSHLDGPNGPAVVGYLQELTEAGASTAFDDFIDGSSLGPQTKLRLTVSGPATERASQRIDELIDAVSVHEAARCMFRWLRETDPESLASRVSSWIPRIQSQADYNAVVDLVALYLHRRESVPGSLRSVLFELVELRLSYPSVQQQEWDWAQLARRFLAHDPASLATLLADLVESEGVLAYSGSHELGLMQEAVRAAGKASWSELMDRIATGSWRLSMAAGGWLASAVDVEVARAWVGNDLSRARTLASVASIGGEELTDVGVYLVEEFGDDQQVSSSLVSEFVSGSWTGPESARIARQIQQVNSWVEDPGQSPAVKRWGRRLLASLEVQRSRALQREAEERW